MTDATQTKELTKKEVMAKIKALGDITKEQRNSIVCSLIGHSGIVTTCFGYVSCARCGEQIGDTLGGCFSLKDCAIVGHNCSACLANYKRMDWRDKLYTQILFVKKQEVVA